MPPPHPTVRGSAKLLLLLLGPVLLAGCYGLSHNPSYFPSLLPASDIVRTHAKPPGHGYFTNFDPHACKLVVRPVEAPARHERSTSSSPRSTTRRASRAAIGVSSG